MYIRGFNCALRFTGEKSALRQRIHGRARWEIREDAAGVGRAAALRGLNRGQEIVVELLGIDAVGLEQLSKRAVGRR